MGFIKHYLWPIVAMIGGPVLLHILMYYPRDSSMEGTYPVDELDEGFKFDMLYGNFFSWTVTLSWLLWLLLFLAIPFDHYIGRATLFGYAPVYVHNGLPLFIINFLAYFMFHSFYPPLSIKIYNNLPYFVGTFNILGLFATGALYILSDPIKNEIVVKEKLDPAPAIYEIFRGVELHPRLYDIDIKQFVVRIGFMTWQMLLLFFLTVSYLQHGFDVGLLINVIVQEAYLSYFFKWEKGFLIALDMTYSRAGFFFCWGFTCWIPFFYSFTTYYLVDHPTNLTVFQSICFLILSTVIIHFKFKVDDEKLAFRETNGKNRKDVSYIEVQYITSEGVKESKLLTSGSWGVARHMNYTFEFLAALSWSLITYKVGTVLTFLYPIYLLVLLIQRTYRDDAKCKAKYGIYWNKYCDLVRYKMVPYLF